MLGQHPANTVGLQLSPLPLHIRSSEGHSSVKRWAGGRRKREGKVLSVPRLMKAVLPCRADLVLGAGVLSGDCGIEGTRRMGETLHASRY